MLPPDLGLDALTFRHRRLPRGQAIDWHDHGRPTLCLVQAGQVSEEDRRGVRDRLPGDLVFRAQPERHRNLTMAAAEILVVEIDPAALVRLQAMGLPASGAHFARSPRTLLLARQLRSLRPQESACDRLEMAGRLFELMAELVRLQGRQERLAPGWLLRVRERLHADLAGPPDLLALARDTPVSSFTLLRRFRRQFGVSITEYLMRLRLDEASRLLADTAMPIAQVALEAGFCDQSHLTRVMRQRLGVTPAAFRRRRRDAG